MSSSSSNSREGRTLEVGFFTLVDNSTFAANKRRLSGRKVLMKVRVRVGADLRRLQMTMKRAKMMRMRTAMKRKKLMMGRMFRSCELLMVERVYKCKCSVCIICCECVLEDE